LFRFDISVLRYLGGYFFSEQRVEDVSVYAVLSSRNSFET